jgi:hypothetical protein
LFVPQPVLHEGPPHTYAPQFEVDGGAQLPVPSQYCVDDCTPEAHVAATHTVEMPGSAPHVARFEPSHCAAQLPLPVHFERLPCGAPATAEHTPRLPATLHASHCPLHAELQQ